MKEYEYECKVKALSGQRFFLEHFVGVWLDLINPIPCWLLVLIRTKFLIYDESFNKFLNQPNFFQVTNAGFSFEQGSVLVNSIRELFIMFTPCTDKPIYNNFHLLTLCSFVYEFGGPM